MGKEIDKTIDSLQGKNARERKKALDSSMSKDMLSFSRLISEVKQENEDLKKGNSRLSELVDILKGFYKDLELEGIIKIERELFMTPMKESIKQSDEREKGCNSFKEVRELKLNHKQAFNKLIEFYHGAFCFFLKYDLRIIAKKLAGRKLRKDGEVLQELKKYKKGKYENIFDCLNSQIKNSISHKDFLINQKDPKIAFIDENKPNLNLTLNEFKEICGKLLFLQLAHDILTFELIEEVNFDIAKKLGFVDKFMKTYGGKIVKKSKENNAIDLYKLGKILELNKGKWN